MKEDEPYSIKLFKDVRIFKYEIHLYLLISYMVRSDW